MCVAAIFSCKEEPKPLNDYVTFSGKIENKSSDSLFLFQGRQFSKNIKVEADGSFKDTLKVVTGMYGLYDGNESSNIFLKNGMELEMALDTKEFDESISFKGMGSESNNYLAKKALMQEELMQASLFDLEVEQFNEKVKELEGSLTKFLKDNSKNLDSTLIEAERKEIAQFRPGITRAYQQQKQRASMFASYIGKPSANFANYENAKGGKTSLSDLKGKYVYVDVWATWCGPCLREIPSLKEVEKEFHGKNIEFVSLSVDDGRGFKGDAAAARVGWLEMVKTKELGGVQILADKGWKSEFVQGFKINSIPRFILIDPAGNVVNADAPRPSSPKLKELFNSLENI